MKEPPLEGLFHNVIHRGLNEFLYKSVFVVIEKLLNEFVHNVMDAWGN